MRFETFIALRYLRGKRKSRLLSLITYIAMGGVAVGVMALVVVMSVVSGFEKMFTETIIGNRAHITVEAPGAYISAPEAFIEQLEKLVPEVIASSPISMVSALMQHSGVKDGKSGGFVMGIDPAREQQVTCLGDNLTPSPTRAHAQGRMPRDGEIVLGYRLAEKINARIGDQIRVLAELAKPVTLTVCGLAESRRADIDAYTAYVTLPTAFRLSGRNGADAVQCKIADPMNAAPIARKIEDKLGIVATAWHESQREYFIKLQESKGVLFIILVFIILVASFNIASTLIMMVFEKRQDVGILRTLGVSGTSVLFIFMVEGLLIGAAGTLAGVVAGSLIALNIDPVAQAFARMMGLGSFRAEIYNIDRLPAAVDPGDITTIALAAILLTFISTIYPAWSASRLNPIDALRRE